MLQLLFSAVLALSPTQGQDTPPDAKAIEAAVAELKTAFEKGKPPDRVIAIEKAARVVDGSVIAWVAKGLKVSEATVQDAAVEALRFMKHPDALEALHDCAKRDKKLQKEPEAYSKLIKAIGQHGSTRSIEILAEGGITSYDYNVVEARILSLANIRSEKSVEQLIGTMRTAGREKVAPHMAAFRMALMRLTGADEGLSQDAWSSWWNEHKKDFVVNATPPPTTKT